MDRDLRPWAEECDQMQGVQILAGGDDAWAGFASSYAERVRDEFGKKEIWVWAAGEEQERGPKAKQALRAVNAARMVCEMSTYASMYVPVSLPAAALPPYLELDRESQWHVSALISSALETLTIPSRLRTNGHKRGLLDNLTARLNLNGNQRIAQLQCSFVRPEAELNGPKFLKDMDDRMRSNTTGSLTKKGNEQREGADLDIDLSGGQGMSAGNERHNQSNHIFGGFESVRGTISYSDDEINRNEVPYCKETRPYNGMPIVERYGG